MATIKIGTLLVKTLAKPVVSSIKSQTKTNPNFKKFCVNVAQTTHRWEMQLKMRFLGYEKERIRPLSEARAVETGANFLGETLLFAVAIGAIAFETIRSQRKSSNRKTQVDAALDDVQGFIEGIENDKKLLRNQLGELQGQIDHLVELNKLNIQLLNTFAKSYSQPSEPTSSWFGWLGWGNKEVTKPLHDAEIILKELKKLEKKTPEAKQPFSVSEQFGQDPPQNDEIDSIRLG
ncbi:OPA3-domain-containing protein [Conidiobolus coronatus NRRL 28638]|uniref:OPA3-domain-containing protein n=1 Tax=Conidiobolus coronatus (strain ATCC 28846 / CBS 209.66 / NRRL 28638) TaxID=796925 RepID=A0A137P6R7_CONC2|nr:OPA3-domain-containing protein [Conidiobolus coronatus NRRL 28638]|eukprot:KXN70696.1 OPA3-domain-containing protein [Conidiobolus coronatus NRRL 28638]